MKRIVIVGWVTCFPAFLQAADLPNVINANDANTQRMCVERAVNDCINTICLNSPDRSCTDNCQSVAENKCKAMQE